MTYEEIKKRVDEKAPHASEGFRRAMALIIHVPPSPCPFCGGAATLYYHLGRELGHEGFATICCNTENCRGNSPMAVPPVGDIERELARWNRRA